MKKHQPSRRAFLVGSTLSAGALMTYGKSEQAESSALVGIQEFTLGSTTSYPDPFWDVEVDVLVISSDGKKRRIPAFWSGGNVWRWRFSSSLPGKYQFRTLASDTGNPSLHDVKGEFEIKPYTGNNQLLKKGALRVSNNQRFLENADSSPFLWLGDTWWMALTERLQWPKEFKQLTEDRRKKGFNVIQLVAGLYPDMDSFDARGKNEAGFPWQDDYTQIHPAWWDLADQRIAHLVDSEMLPCILGCWGYYLNKLGMKKMKAHWRYVIARWGAYPVVWCLAGEGSMPWYLSKRKKEEKAELKKGWTELASYVKKIDPWQRLVTIHPSRSSRETLLETHSLDFDMLQTGHGDYRSIPNTLERITAAVAATPTMPVLEAEVCYEGIMASCRQDIQRFLFWSSLLNGACGFTYGANGIWQVNRKDQAFGPSPHGRNWGNTSWQDAMNYPGGQQVGVGAKILRSSPWHKITPHPEWVSPHWNKKQYHNPSAAGIPGKLRIIYTPPLWNPPILTGLEKKVTYQARLVNPNTGDETPLKPIQGNAKGEHQLSTFPEQRDWVILLENKS